MRSLRAVDRQSDRRRLLRRAGGWSFGFTVALAVVFVAAVLTPAGQLADSYGLGVFAWLPPWADAQLRWVRQAVPYLLGIVAVTLGLFEIRKGLWRDALAGVGGIVCAYAASGLLKNLMLDRPYFGEFGYTFNTYPSGHVAVSMLAGIMVVRMLPGSHTRIVAAYGLTACVTLVGISSVTSLAHRPSDVLGGLALSGIIAPWAVRARLPSLRRFSAHLHGPFGAAAAGLISLAALAPFAGVSVGTIAYFTTATLVTTALLVWVSTSECVRPPPHCHPRGRRRPEA